jgi:hypothetical protein
MATLQLTLPDRLKAAAEARAAVGGFGSVDGYIASLIEADELEPFRGASANTNSRHNLAESIRARFGPLGGVELPETIREPMRVPPDFGQ